MNIVLLSLSLMRPPYSAEQLYKEINYRWDDNTFFTGIQTNEAAVKFYIWKLAAEGRRIDKIIYMASRQVLEDRVVSETPEGCAAGGELTTEQFFIKRMTEYLRQFGDLYGADLSGLFCAVPANDSNIPAELTELLDACHKKSRADGGHLTVYPDTTGGRRDDSNRLQLLIRFLTYRGIEVSMPVYSGNINNDSKIEIVDAYELLDVLDGISRFTETGSSVLLKRALGGRDEAVDALLESMNRFSEDIQLCRVDRLTDILDEMNERLTVVEEKKPLDNVSLLFGQCIPIIREKFFLARSEKMNAPLIVRWCLENGLIQQALTVYTEKVPEFIVKNVVEYKGEAKKNPLAGDEYYAALYMGLLCLWDDNETERLRKEYLKIKPFIADGGLLRFKSSDKRLSLILSTVKRYTDRCGIFRLNDFLKDVPEDSPVRAMVERNFQKKGKASAEAVLNSIFNAPDLIAYAAGIRPKENDPLMLRLENAERLEKHIRSGRAGLKAPYTAEEARNILYDYIYIKCFRNRINHAVSEDTMSEASAKRFRKLGYDPESVGLSALEANIRRGTDRLLREEGAAYGR